ncbi:MAG: hypothetical protein ACFB10_10760 [Salibacteraceae bacterium]
MKISSLLLLPLLLMAGLQGAAQTSDSSTMGIRSIPIQVSLVPPLSSNGLESGHFINSFSFNLLAGVSGGIDGVEIGGFSNLVKGDVRGVQIAGFSNSVGGMTDGVQIGGFANYNQRAFLGAQIGGFANVVNDDFRGVQLGGFANRVKGNMEGAQVAGFTNVNHGKVTGIQISGFANKSQNVTGIQIGGFTNLNENRVEGLQIAGFYNRTRTLKGLQIGVVNVVDSLEAGASIGLINIVKNGYKALEIESSPTLVGSVNFKSGSEYLYNIYSLSLTPIGDDVAWGYGLGLGSRLPITDRWTFNFEALAHQIHEANYRYDRLNMLNRLKVNASYAFGNGMEIYAGPVANVQVSSRFNRGRTEAIQSELAAYDGISWNGRNTRTHLYFGATAGLRIPILSGN